MADILTGGRVIFGVGRGYHTREVETFGAPMLDNDANKEFFEEQMEIILKCFNEESFSYQGKHYTDSSASALSRLRPERNHRGAAPNPPAGGDLAADRQRTNPRICGENGLQGGGRAHR